MEYALEGNLAIEPEVFDRLKILDFNPVEKITGVLVRVIHSHSTLFV